LPGTGLKADVYSQDEAASPLACTWQEQFCNPNLPEDQRCTALGTAYDVREELESLFQDEPSRNRAIWLARVFWALGNDPFIVSSTLNAQSLLARRSIMGGLQGPLPDDQWKIDMQYWFEVGLASMQQAMLDGALGLPKTTTGILLPPSTDEERKVCNSQVRIRQSPYNL
jgi:hypothetical protein